MARRARGRRAAGRSAAPSRPRIAARRRREIARLEPEPQRPILALAPGDAASIGAAAAGASAPRRGGRASRAASCHPARPRRLRQHVHGARGAAAGRRAIAARSRCASRSMRRAELVLRRDDHLRGGRRRRRAQVGDEVGDREVDLVADRRRRPAPGDAAIARATGSWLNGPQILEPIRRRVPTITTSTPGDLADRAQRLARSPPPRRRPARASAGSRRCAFGWRRAQDLDDVAERRAVERGDDADLARQRGQRPLARLDRTALPPAASSSAARRPAAARRGRAARRCSQTSWYSPLGS